MRRRTRDLIFNAALAGVIAIVLALILRPLAEKERAERKAIEAEIVAEWRAQDLAYQREVEAERARWEAIENELNVSVPVTEPTADDIAEENYWDELSLLAAVVEAEAGNQDLTGKRLVVDVVLNRVDSPLWPNTITEVLMQEGQFTTMWNGAVEEAGWHMQDDDYKAVMLEVSGERLDSSIYFFTAGAYNSCGKPAYIHGDHYFNYLSAEAEEKQRAMCSAQF